MEARICADELEPSEDFTLMLWKGVPYTGIAYEADATGRLVAEVAYKSGQKCGLAREWAASGGLVREQSFAFDALHGEAREWYEDGNLRSVGQFELGICIAEVQYDPLGAVTREFSLRSDSPQSKTLERLRKLAQAHD